MLLLKPRGDILQKKSDSFTFEEKAASIITIIMVLMVVGQVLSRYLLHKSISYTEESVRYLFVWATFIGSSAALYRRAHISLSFSFGDSIPGFRGFRRCVTFLCALLFSSVIIVYGFRVVFIQFITGQTTASMGYPMWIIGLAVPVSGLFLVYRIILLRYGKGKPDE